MAQTKFHTATDLIMVRVQQAQLLKERAKQSCIFVSAIITYVTAAIVMSHSWHRAAIWFSLSMVMIAVTYGYSRFKAKHGITIDNYQSYLVGHVIVTCITGIVWSGFAIFHSEWTSYATLFISGTIVCSITLGGMFPSAAYRPAYVGLAIFTLLPLAFYWLLYAPGAERFIGIGLFLYFIVGLFTSAQAELNTRDGILAQQTQALTERLYEQNKIIQKAHDDKTRFLAATSHDLSQPLHAQGFFIQSLKNALTTPQQYEILEKIEASWRNQSDLLAGLVDITRLDSGAITPSFKTINLKTEMENICAEFGPALKSKNHTLSQDFIDVSVRTDPVLLARICRNILSNAIKFTPENGEIACKISKASSGTLVLTISDTGYGVPKEDHARIFEEYVQLDNASRDREKGLGLGLSIVRRLVDLLQLDYDFDSSPDTGTKFTLLLKSDTAPRIKKPAASTTLQTFSSSPLVVLVDDEKPIRESMFNLLTEWGCQVISTATGQQAIDALSNTSETPTLLIVDKRLAHGEEGFNVILRLREEINEDVPALLISGDISGFDDLDTSNNVHFLTKPVNPKDIKRILNEIVDASN